MTTLTKNKITDSFIELIANLPKPDQFASIKNTALEVLQSQGLPAPKAEEYKFTGVSKKLESAISNLKTPQKASVSSEMIQEALIPGLDADVLVFNNGQWDKEASDYKEENYSITRLTEIPEDAVQFLGKIAKPEKDAFTALNTSLFQDGIYLDVPKNKVVDRPILFLYFNQANEGQVISPRVLIHTEGGSEASFIEKIISIDEEPYFLNGVTEINVGENAHLTYYKFQDENKSAIEVNNFEADVHRDSTFSSVVLSLQGDMIRNNLSLNLLDSGCEGNMYGLYLLNGNSHVDNHTNVDHTMPHSDSNELYKGILDNKSKGVFNGKIFVRQDAQKTNAFQQNNNILLSDDAIIHTKPQLEIWADDVKCSHGCTTGQLDDEALYYLRTRGIGKDKAKGLLLYAFAGEILDHIKNEALKEYCIQLVQERLGKF
ncbi:Fe-S cluster assembly protein SufD [Echinicola jeungdonensis]|uniref:Fe-S cluster assembly protein SufD n=1 Tax=Echinicola jeungdonensis TaxID=709343 RepID=A0ABV5J4C6_9BACT|nr:Fe-S cluster assembly protein SufD [Echinicola jeungdonensis]MDN3670616.1 Fe-S cluster assembly protein SufD [Echinicola jeungdonensis]